MSDLEQLEAGLNRSNDMLALGEAVKRLQKNRDFKKVFLDTYFTLEPQRLTMLLASPNVKHELRGQVYESLQAISEVHSFLNTILAEADRAKDLVTEYQDAIAEEHASNEV